MNMNSMDYNIGDELDGQASSISNVDVGAAAINGLEAVDDELLFQSDGHIALEYDP